VSFLCVRIDLDYVPWDTPDAQQFGHGEPAMLLRLLELARQTGARWHFFASERTLRAFPTEADAVLNDGHDLDYLAKHPEDSARLEEATRLFAAAGHQVRGWAIREPWPKEIAFPEGVEFLSGPLDDAPPTRLFPTTGRSLHEAVRQGSSLRSWLDVMSKGLQGEATVVLSPQVLARVDPRLEGLNELLTTARKRGLPLRTLREALEL
jgi:hypothetical protein